jgi:hypothetical protein
MIKKRYEMKNLSLGELRSILLDDRDTRLFTVFIIDSIEVRYRIDKPVTNDDFVDLISNKLSLGVDGVDSGSFNFLDCDYLDVYSKYPM